MPAVGLIGVAIVEVEHLPRRGAHRRHQCAGDGVDQVVVPAGRMVDGIPAASGSAPLQSAELIDRSRVLQELDPTAVQQREELEVDLRLRPLRHLIGDVPHAEPLAGPLTPIAVAADEIDPVPLQRRPELEPALDQEGERQNPWWGDPSYRILPRTATEKDIRLYHLHIDPSDAEKDLNCLFPLGRLQEMENSGRIGRMSPRHYSTMGYILKPERLLQETVPAMIHDLKQDLADVVVLVPA